MPFSSLSCRLSAIFLILWFPSQLFQAPRCCLDARAGVWLSNVLPSSSPLLSLTHAHTYTHAHTLTFSVMLSSCITCIPISIQVPRGSYSGLKTGRAPGTSAPWSCDPPSLLLQREHLTTSRGSFCSVQLAPNVGSWFSSQLSHPETCALKPAHFFQRSRLLAVI